MRARGLGMALVRLDVDRAGTPSDTDSWLAGVDSDQARIYWVTPLTTKSVEGRLV